MLQTATGTLTSLDDPNAGATPGTANNYRAYIQGIYGIGVNAAGTISGTYIDTNFAYHGFSLSPAGVYTTIDAPGAGTGFLGGTASTATNTTASGSATVGVTTPPTPSFTVSGTSVTLTHGSTTGNTSTITVQPSGGFTGSVSLTASVSSAPTNAVDTPTFSFGSTSPSTITGTAPGTATLTISTTAASSASLVPPALRGLPGYAAGGSVLACVLLCCLPTRGRSQRMRTLVGLALLAILSSGLLACSGSSNSARAAIRGQLLALTPSR